MTPLSSAALLILMVLRSKPRPAAKSTLIRALPRGTLKLALLELMRGEQGEKQGERGLRKRLNVGEAKLTVPGPVGSLGGAGAARGLTGLGWLGRCFEIWRRSTGRGRGGRRRRAVFVVVGRRG